MCYDLWPNVNSQHIIYSNTHYNFSLLVCAVCPTAINRNYLLTYTCKSSNWHIRIYLMTSSSPYFVTVWENLPLLVKFGKKSKLIEIEKKKIIRKKNHTRDRTNDVPFRYEWSTCLTHSTRVPNIFGLFGRKKER